MRTHLLPLANSLFCKRRHFVISWPFHPSRLSYLHERHHFPDHFTHSLLPPTPPQARIASPTKTLLPPDIPRVSRGQGGGKGGRQTAVMAKKMYTPTTSGSSLERFVGALAMSLFSGCYFYALLWLPTVRLCVQVSAQVYQKFLVGCGRVLWARGKGALACCNFFFVYFFLFWSVLAPPSARAAKQLSLAWGLCGSVVCMSKHQVWFGSLS